MPIFLYAKLAAMGVALAIILYIVNDYRMLKEFKQTASIQIAQQTLVIADKTRRIEDLAVIAQENKERSEAAQTELQSARVDAVKADAEINLTKLQRISEQTRFGKTDADGNTLLSDRMEKATAKLFDEIEELTKKHGQ